MSDTGLGRRLRAGLLGSVLCSCGLAALAAETPSASPFNFEEASRNVPKPRELWPIVRQHCVPLEFKVLADEVVPRDVMWYHLVMRKTGDRYEAFLHGRKPDALMIEVGDTALGFPGYVSSVPQKLIDAPVVKRVSRGAFPKLWSPEP